MKQIPILFSTAMVQAIKAGRKTMTRRVVKSKTPEMTTLMINMYCGVDVEKGKQELLRVACPYGKPGDILWVRESWQQVVDYSGGPKNVKLSILYKADGVEPPRSKWKPSIHMPKEAARIWLEITDIRIELLQDISEEDAIAEGVKVHESGKSYLDYELEHGRSTQIIYCQDYAKDSFRSLWRLINGVDSWNDNPWVWVVEFKVIDKPKEVYYE